MSGSQGVISLIIRAVDKASNEINQVHGTVNKLRSLIAAGLGVTSVILLVRKLQSEFQKAFDAVESVKLSTAGLASMITTFASKPGDDLASLYKESYGYAQLLVQKMEEWDGKTLTNAQDLMAIVETLVQAGVLIDVNNKKQEEGFIAIANTIKILTAQYPNAAAQIRSEARALLEGVVRPGDQLARMLDQKLGGKLKEHIELWKQEGTLIENVGKQLSGFTQGTEDISKTWTAVKSTMETISTRIMRSIFEPVYSDIVSLGKEFTRGLTDQKDKLEGQKTTVDYIRNIIYSWWTGWKNNLYTIKEI
ncbi:MAG: hypothetical protein AB1847_22530, partial [bacterium]